MSTTRPRWQVVLASASPARLGLLTSAGIQPRVMVSNVDEDELSAQLTGLAVPELVQALADAKAADVVARVMTVDAPTLVLAADSLFEFGGEVLGKPGTAPVALLRLGRLSGRSGVLHTGHTVVALTPDGTIRQVGAMADTRVDFAKFSDAELAAYVDTGEPLQVAGGFTLDGLAAPFIAGIQGDPSNVIGLSLPLVRRLAAALGVFWPDLWRDREGQA